MLANVLLHESMAGLTLEVRREVLQGLARQLVARIGLTDAHLPLPRRLTSLVEKLNALNYQAGWEAAGAGPRVLFAHCPYAAIIADHPELCQMDTLVLEEFIGEGFTQLAKLGVEGSRACVFGSR